MFCSFFFCVLLVHLLPCILISPTGLLPVPVFRNCYFVLKFLYSHNLDVLLLYIQILAQDLYTLPETSESRCSINKNCIRNTCICICYYLIFILFSFCEGLTPLLPSCLPAEGRLQSNPNAGEKLPLRATLGRITTMPGTK